MQLAPLCGAAAASKTPLRLSAGIGCGGANTHPLELAPAGETRPLAFLDPNSGIHMLHPNARPGFIAIRGLEMVKAIGELGFATPPWPVLQKALDGCAPLAKPISKHVCPYDVTRAPEGYAGPTTAQSKRVHYISVSDLPPPLSDFFACVLPGMLPATRFIFNQKTFREARAAHAQPSPAPVPEPLVAQDCVPNVTA